MSENTAFVLAVAFKCLTCMMAVIGAAYLAYHGKDGWGWLIFVAIILAPGSISTKTDDPQTKTEARP